MKLKTGPALVFFIALIFYYFTSFLFLNKLTVNIDVSFPGDSNDKYKTIDQEPHFYRNIKEQFKKDLNWKLSDVVFLPVIKNDITIFTIKLSLIPNKRLKPLIQSQILLSKDKVLEYAIQSIKSLRTEPISIKKIVSIKTHSFFIDSKNPFIKLFIYSLFFSITVTSIIFSDRIIDYLLSWRQKVHFIK